MIHLKCLHQSALEKDFLQALVPNSTAHAL